MLSLQVYAGLVPDLHKAAEPWCPCKASLAAVLRCSTQQLTESSSTYTVLATWVCVAWMVSSWLFSLPTTTRLGTQWGKWPWKKQVPVPHLTAICPNLQCPVPGVSWELAAQKKWVRRKELSPGLSFTSCNDTDIWACGINFLLEILSPHLPVPTRRWTWCACLLRASCSSFHRPLLYWVYFLHLFSLTSKRKTVYKKKKKRNK